MTHTITPNTEPSVTRFFFIRHGQTEHNIKKILQGHLDTSLNDEGRSQALKLADAVKEIPFDKIYSSDLTRCRETLGAVLEAMETKPSVAYTEHLRERHMGIIEGMHIDDAIRHGEKHGKSYRDFGESVDVFTERIGKYLEQVGQETTGMKNVAVVSHGGTIRSVLRLCGRTEGVVYNTSITVIDVKDGEWVVRVVGDTKHLGEQLQVNDQRVR